MPVTIDSRLMMLADMVPGCRVAADIGADHGFLGVYLAQTGRCGRVILTDISEKSLEKARRLAKSSGVGDRIDFRVGSGAEPLDEPVDAAIVAGMGGETIAQIVEIGKYKLGGARIIMQPNTSISTLRVRLERAGYQICDENISRTAGRWYVAMAAVPGESSMTDAERAIGPILLSKRPALLEGYAAFWIRVLEKALTGAEAGRSDNRGAIASELKIWRDNT